MGVDFHLYQRVIDFYYLEFDLLFRKINDSQSGWFIQTTPGY